MNHQKLIKLFREEFADDDLFEYVEEISDFDEITGEMIDFFIDVVLDAIRRQNMCSPMSYDDIVKTIMSFRSNQPSIIPEIS